VNRRSFKCCGEKYKKGLSLLSLAVPLHTCSSSLVPCLPLEDEEDEKEEEEEGGSYVMNHKVNEQILSSLTQHLSLPRIHILLLLSHKTLIAKLFLRT